MTKENDDLTPNPENHGETATHSTERKIDVFLRGLEDLERQIECEVSRRLDARKNGTWTRQDDDIFEPHIWYVGFCRDRFLSQRASALWLTKLAPMTEAAESHMRSREGPQARIHKAAITWTATDLHDCIQLMLALHRLAACQVVPDNAASRHLRVQALTDLILVVESTLGRWQRAGIGELNARMLSLLPVGSGARASFDALHTAFIAECNSGRIVRKETSALNWAINECLGRFDVATTPRERAGIACYLAYQLRNGLMHVIDDSVNLYADKSKLMK